MTYRSNGNNGVHLELKIEKIIGDSAVVHRVYTDKELRVYELLVELILNCQLSLSDVTIYIDGQEHNWFEGQRSEDKSGIDEIRNRLVIEAYIISMKDNDVLKITTI